MANLEPEERDAAFASERQNLQELLQESEEQFYLIADATPVMIWMADCDRFYNYFNSFLLEFTGCSLEQQLGNGWTQCMHPEDQERRQNVYLSAFNNREKFQVEYRLRRADGEYRWVLDTGVPRLTANGNFLGYIGSCIDITERKQTEEQLHTITVEQQSIEQLQWEINHRVQLQTALVKQQKQQQVILDAVPAMIWFKDTENRILRVNKVAAKAINLPIEEIEGKSTYELYPDEAKKYYQDDLEVINSGRPKLGIVEIIRTASGEKHWVQTDKIPWRDDDGNIAGVVVFAVDVTERQQAEESLRQSEQRYCQLAQQKELLYRISNQIRNSLNLDTILETAVSEIRNLLQIDWCLFSWYRVHTESVIWEVVHEAKNADFPSLVGYYPSTVLKPQIPPLSNLEVLRIDDVHSLQDDVAQEFFQTMGCKSMLNLPIQTRSGEVGVVTCVNGNSLRNWADEEMALLQAVCDQLAIAINQAELYAQSITAASVATDKATQLEQAMHTLKQTQTQLIQTEKMSSLGQLVAGIAHEINNPVSFISGNVDHTYDYIQNLLNLLQLYRVSYPQPLPEIQALSEAIEIDFLLEDLPKALFSMKVGAERIHNLVLSLRNFSRVDEDGMKLVNIHEGLDNTLLILQHRLQAQSGSPEISVIKEYGQLPLVNCYPGQLNQVFMNLLTNAIDALEESEARDSITAKKSIIRIGTEVNHSNYITIRIADNGTGITEAARSRLFDPFFTTKPIGKGTGLGLSISYKIIVEKHKGTLHCNSELGKGTEFVITIPCHHSCML